MLRSDSPSSSSGTPACGTQPRTPSVGTGQSWVNGSGVSEPALVNVELAGVAKSAWKRQTAQAEAFAPISVNGFGAPAGGWVDPSREAGMSWLSFGPSMPVLMTVAGLPASIADRSSANGCGPRKAVPDALKMLKLM